jgi:hypothetical protein
MAEREMPKRRRAPGGGRKPAGPFSELREVMSIRMTTEMRDELGKAAKANTRSITQELLRRLQWSFDEDRKNYRDPAIKGLCFIFAELADYIHHGTPDWRSDPFLFAAFRLAVPKLLDGLPKPAGKVQTPLLLKAMLEVLSADDPMNRTEWAKGERERLTRVMKSPEALAEFAVDRTLTEYFNPSRRYKDWEPHLKNLDAMPDMPPGFGSAVMQHQANTFYGMQQARDALTLKPQRRKP